MTTTYTNITLLNIGQDEAADWLTENGYTGVVSPVIDDLTVIYDNVLREYADKDEPLEELLKLASEISYEFGCVAWLVIVDDDNVLIYSLYIDGKLMDNYGVKSGENPDGGDAELLADTFDAPKRSIKYVRAALNRDIPSARDRHAQVLTTLELPRLALGTSYESVMEGTLPEGVESEDELMIIQADEE